MAARKRRWKQPISWISSKELQQGFHVRLSKRPWRAEKRSHRRFCVSSKRPWIGQRSSTPRATTWPTCTPSSCLLSSAKHALTRLWYDLRRFRLDSLCGDFITEDLGQVLASVCGGELAGIQSLIENEATDQWVRGAALSSLVTLVAAGQKSRDEIVGYFVGLFRGKLVRKWSHVWDTLVSYSCDLYPEELFDDIKRAYEDGLVDPGYIGFDHVKRDLALGKDRILARLADNPHRRLVEDTVAEMGWWACFRDDRAKNTAHAVPNSKLNPAVSSPIRRATPKTGRNEPCPCGSGKKYKKCCGA